MPQAVGYKAPRPHVHGAGSGYDIEKFKHVYLDMAGAVGGYYAVVNASDQADIAVEDAFVSAGTGNPSPGEVTDSGVCGLHLDADGDGVAFAWPIPFDLDIDYEVEFRVHWSSGSTTTTDTIEWIVKYKELTVDSTAIDAPSTALNTVIATDTNVAGVNAWQATAWGKINGGTLTNGRILLLDVACTDGDMTYASEATYGHFVEIRYVRRAL